MLCVYCNHPIQQDSMHYVLSSLGSELFAWVMVKMKCEDIDDSHLCEKCFNTLTKQWVQIQEPEIQVHTAVMDGSDPLTELLVKLEDMNPVKDEPKLENSDIEDNNDVTDIDTEEESHLQKRFELQQFSDSDSTSLSSLSSDDDKQNDSEWPPELSGKTLTSWTKCDWCRTGIKETTYRILPDGPEKAIIVSKTLNREKSPERVCNSCWHKASTLANREIRKEHREVKKAKLNNDSDNSHITIPGYQRVAKSCRTCIVRECKNTERNLMPRYLRKVLIEYYNVFVGESNRICSEHIKNYYRDWSDLKNQKNIEEMTATDIKDMLNFLREEALKLPN